MDSPVSLPQIDGLDDEDLDEAEKFVVSEGTSHQTTTNRNIYPANDPRSYQVNDAIQQDPRSYHHAVGYHSIQAGQLETQSTFTRALPIMTIKEEGGTSGSSGLAKKMWKTTVPPAAPIVQPWVSTTLPNLSGEEVDEEFDNPLVVDTDTSTVDTELPKSNIALYTDDFKLEAVCGICLYPGFPSSIGFYHMKQKHKDRNQYDIFVNASHETMVKYIRDPLPPMIHQMQQTYILLCDLIADGKDSWIPRLSVICPSMVHYENSIQHWVDVTVLLKELAQFENCDNCHKSKYYCNMTSVRELLYCKGYYELADKLDEHKNQGSFISVDGRICMQGKLLDLPYPKYPRCIETEVREHKSNPYAIMQAIRDMNPLMSQRGKPAIGAPVIGRILTGCTDFKKNIHIPFSNMIILRDITEEDLSNQRSQMSLMGPQKYKKPSKRKPKDNQIEAKRATGACLFVDNRGQNTQGIGEWNPNQHILSNFPYFPSPPSMTLMGSPTTRPLPKQVLGPTQRPLRLSFERDVAIHAAQSAQFAKQSLEDMEKKLTDDRIAREHARKWIEYSKQNKKDGE